MTITKKMKVGFGAALATGALLMVASAVSANSRAGDKAIVAAATWARPLAILAIVSPKDDGAPGTIFFGEGVADRSDQHFGGPR